MAKRLITAGEATAIANEVVNRAKASAESVQRLARKHAFNMKAMGKVASALKRINTNQDNIIQGPDACELEWCINVLNNPEE